MMLPVAKLVSEVMRPQGEAAVLAHVGRVVFEPGLRDHGKAANHRRVIALSRWHSSD
jgi:hypothetical protein